MVGLVVGLRTGKEVGIACFNTPVVLKPDSFSSAGFDRCRLEALDLERGCIAREDLMIGILLGGGIDDVAFGGTSNASAWVSIVGAVVGCAELISEDCSITVSSIT